MNTIDGRLVFAEKSEHFEVTKKELANWIYYEQGDYYCYDCVQDRLNEINDNSEFPGEIDYENGDKCGHFQDYANENREVVCYKCGQPLLSTIDN